jgi:hypothetical protein
MRKLKRRMMQKMQLEGMQPEELELQNQKELLELEELRASGAHHEEHLAKLREMIEGLHEVKRELIKKKPSMRRVLEIARGRIGAVVLDSDETDESDDDSGAGESR